MEFLSPEQLNDLLGNNHTFTFNSKFSLWYIFYMALALIFGLVLISVGFIGAFVGISLGIFITAQYLGILLIVVVEGLIILWVRYNMSFSLELSPTTITLLRNDSIKFQCEYKDLYNVEFFIKTTTVDNVSSKEHKFKIITKQGKTKEITADYWKIPKPLPAHSVLRDIIGYYYQKYTMSKS